MTTAEILADNVLDEVAADPTAPRSFHLAELVDDACREWEEESVLVTAGAGMYDRLSRAELAETELAGQWGDR